MMKMNRLAVIGALILGAAAPVQSADPVYENFGTVTNVPQIDAVTFINHGDFSVATVLPYDTQNTLYYTNFGILRGVPGFRLENILPNGQRRPAASFYNGLDARVFAGDGGQVLLGVILGAGSTPTVGPRFGFSLENAQIIVNATNIVNRGRLYSDGDGLVRLTGKNIDLDRSGVGILPFVGGVGSVTPTNYIPDLGIFDVYWGVDLDPATLRPTPLGGVVQPVRGTTNYMVNTPLHNVTNQSGFGFPTFLSLDNASAFVLTNAPTPTNVIIQAVFVQTLSTNISVDVRFAPSSIPTNLYTAPIVEFVRRETNVLEGDYFTNRIYIFDRLAAETNFTLLTNLVSNTTLMPANYEVTRQTPFEFLGGAPGMPVTNVADLIFNSTYTNAIVTNIYTAYALSVTNVTAVLPNIPGVSLTNLPGRIEIDAEVLNLHRTRIRGEGMVTINAEELSSSFNTAVDSPNLSFNLASQAGDLQVRNLAKDTVERMTGPIYIWSAMWTNLTGSLVTNMVEEPPGSGTFTNQVSTNVIEVGFHVMVVDNQIVTELPVLVPNFRVSSRDLTLADTLRVTESLFVDSESLTLTETGQLLLGTSIQDWDNTNFPNLRRLTNSGTILIPDSGHFGDGRRPAYESIVNSGTIEAFVLAFRSGYFEHSGVMTAFTGNGGPGYGTFTLQADTARFVGGTIEAGGQIYLDARELEMRDTTITTGQLLILSVAESLSDAGVEAPNVIQSEGFQLVQKPATGDLLGTTFQSTAPRFLAIPHVWSGEDRGPTAAGFENNAAIGRLILDGDIDSLLSFAGTNGNRALYVDFLELSDTIQQDPTRFLSIANNMVIYFADSNVPVDQLNGLFADPEAPEGRLRWVPDFAGPNSSVDVATQDNQTVRVNRALRESAAIDSDGDGVANQLDAFPFDADAGQIGLSGASYDEQSRTVTVSWMASPGGRYVVEFTSDLHSGQWERLTQHTNSASEVVRAVVQDTLPEGTKQRFYRVRPAGAAQ